MAWLALRRLTRLLLFLGRPRMFRMWNNDWPHQVEVMRAHHSVQQVARYVALVFEKPA